MSNAADPYPQARDIAALFAWFEEAQRRGFAWRRGRDCVSFALGAVQAQTGIDLLDGIALWSTRHEALEVARALGGLEAALDTRMDRIPPALAARGDVAGLPDRMFGVRLMVVEGVTLVGPGSNGLERLERKAMTVAWSATSARSQRGE